MLRISAGFLAAALLSASLQAQTIYPPETFAPTESCPVPYGPPAATWPYGYYQTMWGRGVPYGFYYTSWTQGVCPGAVPADGFPMAAPGTPVPSSPQPLPPGEDLGAPRPLPSKPQ